jgi:hypothetical protein
MLDYDTLRSGAPHIPIGNAIEPALNITSEAGVSRYHEEDNGTDTCRGIRCSVEVVNTKKPTRSLMYTYNACTLEFFTRRHHSQQSPLTRIVQSMIASASMPLFREFSSEPRSIADRNSQFNDRSVWR